MDDTVISVEGVSKRYLLAHRAGGEPTSFREYMATELRGIAARLTGRRPPPREEFWALSDVSFGVRQGETVGIVGRNGAGKSTLLKILSRITEPTKGRVRLKGRVASLLEVGTGFHPELTGRENVYLNGAILGMSRVEIRRKFDEIVAFAEVERFLDTPVKRYSSGMYVRLAFAVAAHLEPEILVVDEVLAVGDAQFQKKCLGKMGDVSREGRTVLFVSHSMPAVAALCSRAVLLRAGRVVMDGEARAVTGAYLENASETAGAVASVADHPRTGTGKGRFTSLEIEALDRDGAEATAAVTGCDLVLRTVVECREEFADANVGIEIWDTNGTRVIDANLAMTGEFLSLRRGQSALVEFRLRDLLLRPGEYFVTLWLGRASIESMDHVEAVRRFSVNEDVRNTRHTQNFPGVYRCRFEHSVEVRSGATVG
jgi:lipopolysaccharide transport system ATP-binding protein